jgi:hypothetical protein
MCTIQYSKYSTTADKLQIIIECKNGILCKVVVYGLKNKIKNINKRGGGGTRGKICLALRCQNDMHKSVISL